MAFTCSSKIRCTLFAMVKKRLILYLKQRVSIASSSISGVKKKGKTYIKIKLWSKINNQGDEAHLTRKSLMKWVQQLMVQKNKKFKQRWASMTEDKMAYGNQANMCASSNYKVNRKVELANKPYHPEQNDKERTRENLRIKPSIPVVTPRFWWFWRKILKASNYCKLKKPFKWTNWNTINSVYHLSAMKINPNNSP